MRILLVWFTSKRDTIIYKHIRVQLSDGELSRSFYVANGLSIFHLKFFLIILITKSKCCFYITYANFVANISSAFFLQKSAEFVSNFVKFAQDKGEPWGKVRERSFLLPLRKWKRIWIFRRKNLVPSSKVMNYFGKFCLSSQNIQLKLYFGHKKSIKIPSESTIFNFYQLPVPKDNLDSFIAQNRILKCWNITKFYTQHSLFEFCYMTRAKMYQEQCQTRWCDIRFWTSDISWILLKHHKTYSKWLKISAISETVTQFFIHEFISYFKIHEISIKLGRKFVWKLFLFKKNSSICTEIV